MYELRRAKREVSRNAPLISLKLRAYREAFSPSTGGDASPRRRKSKFIGSGGEASRFGMS